MSNTPRADYIGSYDAGCILNMNPYRPRLLVYNDKLSRIDKDLDNPHIHRGNQMEPLIEAYMKKIDPTINNQAAFDRFDSEGKSPGASITGTDNQIFMRHPKYPHVGGHPDGIGEDTYYEFKAPTQRKVGWISESQIEGEELIELLRIGAEISMEEIFKTGVPAYWVVQVQHGLWCTGLPKGELDIWDYDAWAPLRIPIMPDKALHEQMEIEYEIFWNCVKMGIPPQGDTPAEMEWCEIIDDDYLDGLLRDYKIATSMRYDGTDDQKKAKAKLLTYVGDRQQIITPNYCANIIEVDRGTFSYKRIIVKDAEE